MTDIPTSELIAQAERAVLLQLPIGVAPLLRNAAVRLAELDAKPCPHVVSADEGTSYCSLNCPHDALLPPCPTCGGEGTSKPVFSGSTIGYVSIVCDDCKGTGKVTIERLVTIYELRGVR